MRKKYWKHPMLARTMNMGASLRLEGTIHETRDPYDQEEVRRAGGDRGRGCRLVGAHGMRQVVAGAIRLRPAIGQWHDRCGTHLVRDGNPGADGSDGGGLLRTQRRQRGVASCVRGHRTGTRRRQGGREALDRRAGRQPLPEGRPHLGPRARRERHDRRVQHGLRRRALDDRGPLPGGSRPRVHRHRRLPDHGRGRFAVPARRRRVPPQRGPRGRGISPITMASSCCRTSRGT